MGYGQYSNDYHKPFNKGELLATAHRIENQGGNNGADYFRSSLNHHTTGKPVYKCVMLANGEILVGVHS